MIVDHIHDHTYLAWGTFWRRSNRNGYGRRFSSSGFGASYFDFWFTLLIKDIYDSYDFSPKKKKKKKKDFTISKFKPSQILKRLTVPFLLWDFLCQNKFYRLPLSSIVFLRNTFLDCYCDTPIWLIVWCVCGCVISPISGIYCVDLGFINNYKEPE